MSVGLDCAEGEDGSTHAAASDKARSGYFIADLDPPAGQAFQIEYSRFILVDVSPHGPKALPRRVRRARGPADPRRSVPEAPCQQGRSELRYAGSDTCGEACDTSAEPARFQARGGLRCRSGKARGKGADAMKRDDDGTAEAMRSFGTLGSVGLAFVIAIVLGAGGGLLIDRWIGRGHWGFFIGFFLGMA